jgi:alkylation response protein AidB-like acyl-CoA dehydrogenase
LLAGLDLGPYISYIWDLAMNQFSLTDEQKDFANRVLHLARTELESKSSVIDEQARYPREVIKKFAEFGLFGLAVPKKYGGSGHPLLDICLAIEQVARVDNSAALCVGVNVGGLSPILQGGNEEQKGNYLPRIAKGESIIGVAFTEPEAGSDLGSLRTRAVRKGDHYDINGRKCFISNAGVASGYSLLARTGPGKTGISAFILDADVPGLEIGRIERKMGARGSPTGELIFEDCRIPLEKRLGEEGAGFDLAKGMLRLTRPLIGAQGVGLATGAFEYALGYAREYRERLLSTFDVIQYMLADMAIKIEAARQLVYQAASLVDANHSEASKFSSMVKCFASDVAMEVSTDAIQIFGLRGYSSDYPVGRFMRDAKLFQIYEGTNQIQRVTIAKALLAVSSD